MACGDPLRLGFLPDLQVFVCDSVSDGVCGMKRKGLMSDVRVGEQL